MALRKGDGMIEFFALLPAMREMYEKKGIVVAKRMYEILIEEKKISMGYKNFAVLFRKNLATQKENFLTPKNEVEPAAKEPILTPQKEEIKIPKIGEEGHKPHRMKKEESRGFTWDSGVGENTRTL